MTTPAASDPQAVATDPTTWYRANSEVRPRASTSCESEACSMARNGPTSLPLGLSTPSVAATSRTGNAVLPANTIPAPTISSDPRNSVRLRPNRSARVVRSSEIAASPSSVRPRSSPTSAPLKPIAPRYSTRTTARKP